MTKPFMFIQLVKRKTGGKSMGSGWKGRKCWAVVRVARTVGGTELSIYHVVSIQNPLNVLKMSLLLGSIERLREKSKTYRPMTAATGSHFPSMLPLDSAYLPLRCLQARNSMGIWFTIPSASQLAGCAARSPKTSLVPCGELHGWRAKIFVRLDTSLTILLRKDDIHISAPILALCGASHCLRFGLLNPSIWSQHDAEEV
jgi:hypothetical protein